MATKNEKTPLHKHTHPAYAWIALVFSVLVIMSVAGWYYLTYQDSLNNDVIETVKETTTTTKDTSSTMVTSPIDIDSEITTIQEQVDSVVDTDYESTQLDDTILGIE